MKNQVIEPVINRPLTKNVKLSVLREDLIHPHISGNKARKLKYNLIEAQKEGFSKLLTFGGAFSNHIAAVAKAGQQLGFQTIGVIRGEELKEKIPENPTLTFAKNCGMKLLFVSRDEFKKKETPAFVENLKSQWGDFFLLPEGGTNELAVKGCEEILSENTSKFDYICVPVGTGGTLAGIVRASEKHQKTIGFSALKGTFQTSEVNKYTSKTNYQITDAFCFGGYAKIDSQLIRFINTFKAENGIPLDPVYTGKMMFGIHKLIDRDYFEKNSRILAVHTGGLQGIAGMNQRLKKKNLPLIE